MFAQNNKNSPAQRGARAKHKHEIRKRFHPQLKRLWSITRNLDQRLADGELDTTYREELANKFSRDGYRFCPLVTNALGVLCSLSVLFLRADEPGALIQSGDIDNRLKTLFDALCMPKDLAQLGGYTMPDAGEDPFYCLLEDDRLINNLAIETDTLLEPLGDSFDVNDARLIISVRVWPYRVGIDNLDLI
ncbi:hypothetical protein EN828_27075 [Mesorhizobium sp. M2D.F.Ca.ET.185.01.1.1]|uniref:hypothetical protein n=1 Tax=unclassified Mesorhizobium TaxID=325217 RepID=UPI000FCCC0F3|nr:MULTISPECIES: hypothetical protein [unclassified Mesorhizobium]TGP74747.1 hypothetical protein EN870_26105 [bacterium M00.F.Ca.ET.227.01.1.1]TGP84642.1 hypothetical protein EN864_28910 [bacterium M00.F.Ca.ET.221.01.1.1]TGP87701.1 hypothetical protein EN865_28210 [bacterium M00.F.Ca.ET.222.01.1.1]TGR87390.1 hypothetical protein EN866_28730 [Mesorhizobium sp. M2D.F.Ca.ET.223.01.1.1]TGU42812.1 hypothetical protein EN789_30605 [bacterium M00.F.Ca.ET.146.01.1.1]